MPQQRLHVIVSFRTDDRTWNDPSFRKVYEDIQFKMIDEMGGKETHLQGLTAKDIGKWIKIARNISLPFIPDLQRIREASAGLPIILKEWIRTSANLKYGEIDGKTRCKQITKLQTELTREEKDKLYMLSILLYPLEYKTLISYLEMNNLHDLLEKLKENRIFVEKDNEFNNKKFYWFRHELLQKCFYEDMYDEEEKEYHLKAAIFF